MKHWLVKMLGVACLVGATPSIATAQVQLSTPTSLTQCINGTQNYVVQGGDSLWKLAGRYHTSIQTIETMNHIANPNVLFVGQMLKMPVSGPAKAVLESAQQLLGKVHYLHGGTTPAGFDCSGFVQYVFTENGISLPRTAHEMWNFGKPVTVPNLQAGDLVFFHGTAGSEPGVTHVGIYIGNGDFVEQSSMYNNVVVENLWTNSFYNRHYFAAARVLN